MINFNNVPQIMYNIFTNIELILPLQRGGKRGYAIAIVFLLVALLFRIVLAPVEAGVPFLTFFPAVTLVAVWGGFGPAIFTMIMSSVIVTYLFIPPFFSLHFHLNSLTFWTDAVFIIEELLVIFLVEVMFFHRKNEFLTSNDLRIEKQRLQLMIENVKGISTILLDVQGRIQSWNKGAEKLVGYTEKEIIGKSFDVMFSEEDLAANRPDSILNLALEKGMHSTEGWRIRKDGSRFFADAAISPLYDEYKKVIGFVKVTRDISERYRYEQRLNTIIQSAPVPLFMVNAIGHIVMVNEQAEKLFQYTQEELVGRAVEMLMPSDFRGAHSQHRESYMMAPVSRPMNTGRTLFGRKKSGEEFPIEVGLGAIHDQDEVLVLATIYDISDRIQAEALLVEAKTKSESASRAKSEFLANMSHEIRTPMNAMIGLTQLTLDTELNFKQRDHLQKVFSSSKALLRILDDILDYSKIEAGKVELESIEFSVEEVIKNVSELFSAQIAEKGLEMFVKIDRRIQHNLIGDPLRLGQILNNFVGNAIKFTERGEVYVEADLLRNDQGKVELRFAVKDTGIGIDKIQSERIFTIFSQADTSFTRKYGGTGLGLTISKRLAEMMGGQVSFTSTPKVGSTFMFTATFEQGSLICLEEDIAIQSMRALIIDDQKSSLDILEHYLQKWNFEVTSTTSARTALDLIQNAERESRPYELLLVDWKMPEMDGLELTRQVNTAVIKGSLKHAPTVIMVTAFDKESLLNTAGTHSIDNVLLKPVTQSSLYESLMRIQQPHLLQRARIQAERVNLFDMATPIHGARILLVEDNAINQEVAIEFLSKAGIIIVTAKNGKEAVDLIGKEKFDAVLMDIQMPVMDGLEATRLIRELPAGKDLPILALSAAAMTQDIQASKQAGMNDHIAKPFDPEQLVATLLKWIKLSHTVAMAKVSGQTDILKFPKQLPGFDLPKALHRLHGNEEMLAKLLFRFAHEYVSTPAQVDELLLAGQADKAVSLLHRLKGAAATLGVTKLAEAAIQLEKEIRAGSSLNSNYTFSSCLNDTLKVIRDNVPSPVQTPVKSNVDLDKEAVKITLSILAAKLSNNEIPSDSDLAELFSALTGNVADVLLNKLDNEIQHFNFEVAVETVNEINELLKRLKN